MSVSLTHWATCAVLAAMTLAVSLYFAPRGFHYGFVDMGQDGYQLRQVLDLSRGAVIFRDTFDQYGPLNGYMNTVGFLALGRRLLAVKYFICVWYSAIAIALFVMARHWLGPMLAAFSTIVWLGLAPFYQHGIMISPHVYVLLFQTLATIIAIRTPRLEPSRFVAVGVLAALSWSMKQTIGTLFLASMIFYLLILYVIGRDTWARVTRAVAAVSAGFFGVVGFLLLLLWMRGALRDWYLQTIAFPRDFYLLNYAQHLGWASGVRSYPAVVAQFVRLQLAEAPYWLVLRAVVIMTAAVQVARWRKGREDDLSFVLMASIAAFLWLAAFPSSSFMHQWWTTSLLFAPFVACVHLFLSRFARTEWLNVAATVAAVCLTVAPGVLDRARATEIRAQTLTETLSAPPMLQGIRTDLPTKRALETFYRLMSHYRDVHPGTDVVSIDESDGLWTGIPESLLFLSFFPDASHSQPVYWNLPVLVSTTYPRYTDELWHDAKVKHPLIVDSVGGVYAPVQIPGYQVLVAAQSDDRYWYMYAPVSGDPSEPAEPSLFVAGDGATESGFAERGVEPALSQRLSTYPVGARRGTITPAPAVRSLHIEGDAPLLLSDPALSSTRAAITVYTWPSDLRAARIAGPLQPITAEPLKRSRAVRALGPGGWSIDGLATSRYTDLLIFRPTPVAQGESFLARGELQEGGFQIGFLKDGRWSSYVQVAEEGAFEAILQVQVPGTYSLILSNCIESSSWQIARRHWLRGTLAFFKGPYLLNRFRITNAGWAPMSRG